MAAVAGGEPYPFVQHRLDGLSLSEDGWLLVHARTKPGARYGFLGAGHVRSLVALRKDGHFTIALDRYLEFGAEVPPRIGGLQIEPTYHGLQTRRDHARDARTIRFIPWTAFARVVSLGMQPEAAGHGFAESRVSTLQLSETEADKAASDEPAKEAASSETEAHRRIATFLASRLVRDASNRRRCLGAYSACAVSGEGHRLPDGGTLCEAAHFQPVSEGGPDHIGNLVLLTRSFHGALERGLIAIADDYTILRSLWIRPSEFVTPLNPTERLLLPYDRGSWPDPRFIRWHRENKFRGADASSIRSFLHQDR